MNRPSNEKIENLRTKLKIINSNIVEARNTQKNYYCQQNPRSQTPLSDLRSPRSEISKLQKENRELVQNYREKEDEVIRLTKMVEELQQQLKVSRAQYRAVSVERAWKRDSNKENEVERWDHSYERLYQHRIKRLI
ncbi:unnamed protein product [Blepharisma stoltei]|uniref:Uncharacterized protein n=1 Tax=Blepharisma stoltei TaxID=1481888 RepID=A0AAU9J242_9CILI|nr:unnamed protein product [Blepharisma stoltei]